MKKTIKGNTYFLIILLLQLFLPVYMIFDILNIKDIRVMLLLNHTIIFIVPAIIYIIVTKQSMRDVLKLNKLHLKDSFLLILLAFVCQPIMTFFSLISQFFFTNEIGNFMNEILNTPYIVLLMIVAVLPAITEEITIRGVILSEYKNKNIYVACIATGLLFGIMHLDPQQFLYATVLGFVLAFVVRVTNSIFSASLLHFVVNGTSITLQKVITYLPNNSEVMEQATEISLKTIPLQEKLLLVAMYGAIAILFSIIAYRVIRRIALLNVKRGNISEEELKINKNEFSKEKVFNLPYILIIIVYLIFMALRLMR